MQVWNVQHTARWKYRTQTWCENCHLRTIAELCRAISSQLSHVSTIGEKPVKQQYLLHTSTQYGKLRPTNGWDRFTSLGQGHPHQISMGFASCLRYCSDVAHRRPTKLCMMFGYLLHWYTIYTLSGALAPRRNFARCKIHFTSKSCFLLYSQHYCMALQQRRQPNFAAWYKAPLIFGWAASMLAIGPHSSFFCYGPPSTEQNCASW